MDPLAEKYSNIGSYVFCANNPVNYVDPDGKIILPCLYLYANNQGSSDPILFRSYQMVVRAMTLFGQTKYGSNLIASFINKGDTQYGVKGNGKYAKYTLLIQEIDIDNQQVHNNFTYDYKESSRELGGFNVFEENGKLYVLLKLNLKGMSRKDLILNIVHELVLHGYKIENLIKAYEQGGVEALNKLKATDPNGDNDHNALGTGDTSNMGVKLFHEVESELLKIDPNLKSTFENHPNKYKKTDNEINKKK